MSCPIGDDLGRWYFASMHGASPRSCPTRPTITHQNSHNHTNQLFQLNMSSDFGATIVTKMLEGKVAIVTGGASGIGESTVRLFVQHGAKVLIADVQDKLGESLAMELGLPETVSFVHCNITSDSDVKNAVDTAVSRYGQLDIMYNNAGIGGNLDTTILNSDNDDFRRVLEINLFGSFLGAKHAARVMIPARRGCILFTGSVAASISGDLSYAYKASKHAILGLNNNLTVELGKYGIRVNTISPYGVATPTVTSGMQMDKKAAEAFMSAAGNLRGAVLEPEDVAKAALYLASDDAKYVSGLNLIVDGGHNHNHPLFGASASS
ncbi:Short chain aldehyde dehydrogenase 1 [Linum perenne]